MQVEHSGISNFVWDRILILLVQMLYDVFLERKEGGHVPSSYFYLRNSKRKGASPLMNRWLAGEKGMPHLKFDFKWVPPLAGWVGLGFGSIKGSLPKGSVAHPFFRPKILLLLHLHLSLTSTCLKVLGCSLASRPKVLGSSSICLKEFKHHPTEGRRKAVSKVDPTAILEISSLLIKSH